MLKQYQSKSVSARVSAHELKASCRLPCAAPLIVRWLTACCRSCTREFSPTCCTHAISRARARASHAASHSARPPRRNVHEQNRDYQQVPSPPPPLPRPPPPRVLPAPNVCRPAQVVFWQKLIAYEKSNALRLTPAEVKTRVLFAFKQALLTLRFYPEMWCASQAPP